MFLILLLLIPNNIFSHPTIGRYIFTYFQVFLIGSIIGLSIKFYLFKKLVKLEIKKYRLKVVLISIFELFLLTILFSINLITENNFLGLSIYGETLLIFLVLSFVSHFLFFKFLIFTSTDINRKKVLIPSLLFTLIFPISVIISYFIFLILKI